MGFRSTAETMVLGVGVGGRGTVPPTGLPGHSCTPFPVTSGGVSYPGDVQIPAVSHTPASGPRSGLRAFRLCLPNVISHVRVPRFESFLVLIM